MKQSMPVPASCTLPQKNEDFCFIFILIAITNIYYRVSAAKLRKKMEMAYGGSGEGQAVVAVDGALDAAGPGEGLVRPQEHRADAQQIVGDFTF